MTGRAPKDNPDSVDSVIVAVKLPSDVYAQVKALAVADDRSVNSFVRRLVLAEIKRCASQ